MNVGIVCWFVCLNKNFCFEPKKEKQKNEKSCIYSVCVNNIFVVTDPTVSLHDQIVLPLYNFELTELNSI